MSVTSRAVTVSTTAVRLDTAAADKDPQDGSQIFVYNNNGGAVVLYVGGSDVTSANGVPIANATSLRFVPMMRGDALYGIAASAIDVRVLESGV